MKKGELSELSIPGSVIEVRVTPNASRNDVSLECMLLRVFVTAVPEKGKANAAATKVLANALGIPKSSLKLIRGETSRNKAFLIEA